MGTLLQQRLQKSQYDFLRSHYDMFDPEDEGRTYYTPVRGPVEEDTDYITQMKEGFKKFSMYAVNDYSDSFYLAFMRMPPVTDYPKDIRK